MPIHKALLYVIVSVVYLFLICPVFGQASLDLNLPDKADIYLRAIDMGYALSDRLNPFYLRGDFDGDSNLDYAFLVVSKKTKENGIAFYLSSKMKAFLIGAGVPFNEMTDLDFNGWYVYGKQKVQKGVGEGTPPILKGEAIFVKWEESASAIIYWNGQKFIWYQQGD